MTSGALLFPTGVTTRTLSVPLLSTARAGRQFSVKLSNPIYTSIVAGEARITFSQAAIRRLYLTRLNK